MIDVKTKGEIEIMREGGQKLARIKNKLREKIEPGAVPFDLDKLAERLILEEGGKPSFKMVKNYYFTTCINRNDGVVHGIPNKVSFKEGDIVSLDIAIFYKGFHTDSAFTIPVGEVDSETRRLLEAGEEALEASIRQAKVGNRVSHIARAIEKTVERYGCTPSRDLTGHGVGRNLHEEPMVPCFWEGSLEDSVMLEEGMVLALEAIYMAGEPDIVVSKEDGWTISTRDGKIAGLFEETIAVTDKGPLLLTA
ncbi:MAG: type I methionyl aminopeptidase [bacterium]|nr:type I methionyl aminopeptidase [bacterium]